MIRFRHSLLLALVPCVALAQDAGSTKSPTAGIDKPPRSLSSMQFSRTGGADATGVGGFVGIPASNGTVVVPMNQYLPGTPPPPAPTSPDPIAPVFKAGDYEAASSYYNASAQMKLEVTTTGNCVVTLFSQQTNQPSTSQVLSCGTLVPAGGNPSDYEVLLTPTNTGCTAGYYFSSTPGCTAQVGWVPVSTGAAVYVSTGWVNSCRNCYTGYRERTGGYTLSVRNKTTGVTKQASMTYWLWSET